MSISTSAPNTTNTTTTHPVDQLKKELKLIKKEMSGIVKENQKLQVDLKVKNETINSLIGQNFAELKLLQEKHKSIVTDLATTYESNIRNMDSKHQLFESSFRSKIKSNLNTTYKLHNDKNKLLVKTNENLLQSLEELQLAAKEKDFKIKNLLEEKTLLENSSEKLNFNFTKLEKEAKTLNQKYTEILEKDKENTDSIKDLTSNFKTLQNNYKDATEALAISVIDLATSNDLIKKLTQELEHTRTMQQDLQNKHSLLLNDNSSKQINIDEKTLEILTLNSKINELDKRNSFFETNKKDQSLKIDSLINEIDNLRAELLSYQKLNSQLKSEKEINIDEKYNYSVQLEQCKLQLRDAETNILDKINKMQEMCNKEKEKNKLECEIKVKEIKEKQEKQIVSIKNNYNALVSEKEKQLDGLTKHLESFTDSQHILLSEIEKIKSVNERLRLDANNIDQKINEIHLQNKKEKDEMEIIYKKEKEELVKIHNDTLKKTHESNDAVQTKLNKTLEALNLARSAISELQDEKKNLERKFQTKESEDISLQEKYTDLKTEYVTVREQLERSIDLNNSFSLKEKQQEQQIKQLQLKCNQLINFAKKGSNTHIQNGS